MNAKQLDALLIDQALGELSDEASALLEEYLARFPEHRTETERIRRATSLTEAAILSAPLAPPHQGESEIAASPLRWRQLKPVFRIAAAIAVLGFAAGAGFLAGRGQPEAAPSRGAFAASSPRPAMPSPWAHYRIEKNGHIAAVTPGETKP